MDWECESIYSVRECVGFELGVRQTVGLRERIRPTGTESPELPRQRGSESDLCRGREKKGFRKRWRARNWALGG
ncbi:MAG: hypothetical protein UBAL2_85240046 [Leptospirillum rubarum]|nr:MAG: hypothetical protein UBAL2_85240046 [Leptospirillum rubarum]